MHKSLGNYVAAQEVLAKYGADATRQWVAGGGSTGSDVPFRWPDVEYGWRFLIKLWNASNFVTSVLKDYVPSESPERALEPLDRWILSKTERLTRKVTEAFVRCQFNTALEETRNFAWHVFCDSYLEAVKDRLYKPEVYGPDSKKAAQSTLFNVLRTVLQLLAPITPHLTEEIFQTMYAAEKEMISIHVTSWPTADGKHLDEEAEGIGDMITAVIAEVRREKAEKHLPLNTQIRKLTVYAGEEKKAGMIRKGQKDIAGTCKAASVEILPEKGTGREVPALDISLVTEY
jgi:valyl-tRNA synthetase